MGNVVNIENIFSMQFNYFSSICKIFQTSSYNFVCCKLLSKHTMTLTKQRERSGRFNELSTRNSRGQTADVTCATQRKPHIVVTTDE